MHLADFYELVMHKAEIWDYKNKLTKKKIRIRTVFSLYDPIDCSLNHDDAIVLFYDRYFREDDECFGHVFHVTADDVEQAYYNGDTIEHPLWTLRPFKVVPAKDLL